MTTKIDSTKLLPLNFHMTFKPERIYLHALMKYVAGGGRGTIQDISAQTGIPTGASSGKVQPSINYCMGIGVLQPIAEKQPTGVKALELTDFGRKVFLEDKLLNYPVTQWLAHFNLCHPRTGAAVWRYTFADGYPAPLGRSFSQKMLVDYLRPFFPKAKVTIGPLVSMYEDTASFAVCGALKEINGHIQRTTPPLNDEMYIGYGAWLIQLIEDFFPGRKQVTISDLQSITRWRSITAWSPEEEAKFFAELEKLNILRLDRHMDPWLITVNTSAKSLWQMIYDELL